MRLGVIGSMVWDRIHARDGREVPFEEWGGITYALGAADAAIPEDWTLVPILKVGADLQDQAFTFLRTLESADLSAVRVVDAPNNRVELIYESNERRCERLTGGVPPWTWPELQPILADIDALYINLISGFELDLVNALKLRLGYKGPIYCDLHSVLLGVDATGMRTPQPLAAWREWLRCFDVVQVNEDELALLAFYWGDPWQFAAEVVGEQLKVLLVTLGSRGSVYVKHDEFEPDPMSWRRPELILPRITPHARAISARIDPVESQTPGDPTGCGDVWGATCFCNLLGGRSLEDAMRAANRAAARNVDHRGATGLNHYLKGRITK